MQLTFFYLNTYTSREAHYLMHERFNLFVYISFHLLVFPNKSGRIYPIKLKIDMLYHMNDIFRHTVFELSVPKSEV